MADQTAKIVKLPEPMPRIRAEVAIGRPGLKQSHGYLYEEWLPTLQGRRGVQTYVEMSSNDPVIAGFLFAITSILTAVEWHAEPLEAKKTADVKASDFLQTCLRDTADTWSDFIAEALSLVTFGFSYHETVYKKREGRKLNPLKSSRFDDGMWGWQGFEIRAQEALDRWEFDEQDRLQGMWQRPAPSYREIFIPLRKAVLFRLNPRKTSPEGTSLLRGCYRCYSDDTEILTKDGWLAVGAVTLADELATLNPATHELEYHKPRKVYHYPYKGQMFHQGGRFVDLLVTPNHRMYVRRDGSDHFEFIEAQNLKRSVHFKLDCLWRGTEVAEFALPEWAVEEHRVVNQHGAYSSYRRVYHPEQRIQMDDWLRFFGIWLAEGCTWRAKSGQRFVIISQNEGPKLDLIKTWVEACGFHYRFVRGRSRKRGIEICSAQLYEYLAQFGKAADKFIPPEIKALSARQLGILFDAMHLGDGGLVGNMAAGYRGTRIYFTASDRLADDVSEIILKMGGAPRVRRAGGSHWGDPVWAITFSKARTGGNRANLLQDRRELVDYDGDVHCIEVRNHIVYVRRNGKACWCGNSWFFKKRLQELEAIGVERNLAGLPVMYVDADLFENAEYALELQKWKDVVRNLKRDEQEGVIMPNVRDEQGNRVYELTLLSTGSRRQSDTNALIQRYNAEIAMAALSDFMLLGHGRVGTFALGVTKTELFATAFNYVLDVIASELNEREVPRILALNAMSGEARLVHGRPGNVDIEKFSGMIERLTRAGMPVASKDGKRERFIFEQLGLPAGDIGEPGMVGVRPPVPNQGQPTGRSESGRAVEDAMPD